MGGRGSGLPIRQRSLDTRTVHNLQDLRVEKEGLGMRLSPVHHFEPALSQLFQGLATLLGIHKTMGSAKLSFGFLT